MHPEGNAWIFNMVWKRAGRAALVCGFLVLVSCERSSESNRSEHAPAASSGAEAPSEAVHKPLPWFVGSFRAAVAAATGSASPDIEVQLSEAGAVTGELRFRGREIAVTGLFDEKNAELRCSFHGKELTGAYVAKRQADGFSGELRMSDLNKTDSDSDLQGRDTAAEHRDVAPAAAADKPGRASQDLGAATFVWKVDLHKVL